MQTPTLDYILSLHNIIVAKQDRAEQLERMINTARQRYKYMTNDQLNEAVRDVAGMKREIEELKSYCAHAQKEVDAYFACPSVA